MTITDEMKTKMFEKVLEYEKLAIKQDYYGSIELTDYHDKSDGAFNILEILGLGGEYVKWSYGK